MTYRDHSTDRNSSFFRHPRYFQTDPDYLGTTISIVHAEDESRTPYFKHFFEAEGDSIVTEYELVPIVPATTEGSGWVKPWLTGFALAGAACWYFSTGGCPSASAFTAASDALPGGSTFSPADLSKGSSWCPSMGTAITGGVGLAFLNKVVEQVQKGLGEKSTVGVTAGNSAALSEGDKSTRRLRKKNGKTK